MNIKVSKNPDKNWNNDNIQFARLIAELEASGAFTTSVLRRVTSAMDLETYQVCALIERAQLQWEEIKRNTVTR